MSPMELKLPGHGTFKASIAHFLDMEISSRSELLDAVASIYEGTKFSKMYWSTYPTAALAFIVADSYRSYTK